MEDIDHGTSNVVPQIIHMYDSAQQVCVDKKDMQRNYVECKSNNTSIVTQIFFETMYVFCQLYT